MTRAITVGATFSGATITDEKGRRSIHGMEQPADSVV